MEQHLLYKILWQTEIIYFKETALGKVIQSVQELKSVVEGLKRGGKKVVFTNGCFDILHAGHVDYLEKAQALCELTIAVHCTTLSTRELDVLMERGVSIVLCPRSNLHLKTGFPQVKHLLGYP